jgi:predicted PurR-regulated permease PerM
VTLSARPEARARARARWATLRDRLETVSPEAIGRGLLALGVIALAFGLAAASWPALAPFVVGAVIAYAVLPLANRLARFMPRVLAALLAELVAVGILALAVVAVIPPLVNGLVQVAGQLPTQDEVRASLASFEQSLGELQEPVRGIVLAVVTEAASNLQAALQGFVSGAGRFVATQILGVVGTLSFLLGLLVIPAWILTLVADERSIKRRTTGLLAPAIRGDVVALARIVDRAFGTFLRTRVLLGLVVGFLIWVGIQVMELAGIADFRYPVTAAVLLGGLQLIPELGYFLGFFPILLVLAIGGPVPALAVTIAYVVANRIGSDLVETRVSRGVLDVHPALLIPAIVVLSQFGVLWLLAAAPIVAILRDVTRYLAGRLGDPPAPVNVLPGEPAPAGVAAAGARRVPSVYRRTAPPPFAATRRPPSGPSTAPAAERSAAS